jgi:hypothetical protein
MWMKEIQIIENWISGGMSETTGQRCHVGVPKFWLSTGKLPRAVNNKMFCAITRRAIAPGRAVPSGQPRTEIDADVSFSMVAVTFTPT